MTEKTQPLREFLDAVWRGTVQVVERLLRDGAPVDSEDEYGRLDISDEQMSTELHSELKKAGFVQCRAAEQSALADVLQDIMRRRWNNDQIHIVGSYSDGWGNSLVILNGVTDKDADIDQTQIMQGRKFHLQIDSKDCNCEDRATADTVQTVKYKNGHVESSGSEALPAQSSLRPAVDRITAYNCYIYRQKHVFINFKLLLHRKLPAEASPALSYDGSSLRPAVDLITAYHCCTYPPIEVLQQGYETHILLSVLDSLRQELLTSPCHLVSAAPPGKEGKMLRVSTSFLERTLMRSLTDVQGQVFVLLKYLVKKVLAARAGRSLKTYHAKTMMFYLLDETPADDWQPCNILSLTRRGLQKLLDSLRDVSVLDPDKCMTHFFLRDASLYLKKGHCEKAKLEEEVLKLMEELPMLMLQFKELLRPLSDDGVFRFHPFLILPDHRDRPVPESGKLPYHSVSDAVRSLLMRLTEVNCSSEDLLSSIKRIGDFAATARHCLEALTHLKFENKDEAVRVLRDSMGSEVSRGVPCPVLLESGPQATGNRKQETGSADVLRHLEGTDSAWKFCFVFPEARFQKPKLGFLPESISPHFPYQMHYMEWHYMNMQALHRCLCLHLGVGSEATWRSWFAEVLESEEPDVQELLMVLEFCSDKDLLVRLVHRHWRRVCDSDEVRRKVEELSRDDPHLMQLSITRTVYEAAAHLQNLSGGGHVTLVPDAGDDDGRRRLSCSCLSTSCSSRPLMLLCGCFCFFIGVCFFTSIWPPSNASARGRQRWPVLRRRRTNSPDWPGMSSSAVLQTLQVQQAPARCRLVVSQRAAVSAQKSIFSPFPLSSLVQSSAARWMQSRGALMLLRLLRKTRK